MLLIRLLFFVLVSFFCFSESTERDHFPGNWGQSNHHPRPGSSPNQLYHNIDNTNQYEIHHAIARETKLATPKPDQNSLVNISEPNLENAPERLQLDDANSDIYVRSDTHGNDAIFPDYHEEHLGEPLNNLYSKLSPIDTSKPSDEADLVTFGKPEDLFLNHRNYYETIEDAYQPFLHLQEWMQRLPTKQIPSEEVQEHFEDLSHDRVLPSKRHNELLVPLNEPRLNYFGSNEDLANFKTRETSNSRDSNFQTLDEPDTREHVKRLRRGALQISESMTAHLKLSLDVTCTSGHPKLTLTEAETVPDSDTQKSVATEGKVNHLKVSLDVTCHNGQPNVHLTEVSSELLPNKGDVKPIPSDVDLKPNYIPGLDHRAAIPGLTDLYDVGPVLREPVDSGDMWTDQKGTPTDQSGTTQGDFIPTTIDEPKPGYIPGLGHRAAIPRFRDLTDVVPVWNQPTDLWSVNKGRPFDTDQGDSMPTSTEEPARPLEGPNVRPPEVDPRLGSTMFFDPGQRYRDPRPPGPDPRMNLPMRLDPGQPSFDPGRRFQGPSFNPPPFLDQGRPFSPPFQTVNDAALNPPQFIDQPETVNNLENIGPKLDGIALMPSTDEPELSTSKTATVKPKIPRLPPKPRERPKPSDRQNTANVRGKGRKVPFRGSAKKIRKPVKKPSASREDSPVRPSYQLPISYWESSPRLQFPIIVCPADSRYC